MWHDARGVKRVANVETRDVSHDGVYLMCTSGDPIPLYRLVQLQLEPGKARDSAVLPAALKAGSVLSAVYRLGPAERRTGAPSGYALRLLLEPDVLEMVAVEHHAARSIA